MAQDVSSFLEGILQRALQHQDLRIFVEIEDRTIEKGTYDGYNGRLQVQEWHLEVLDDAFFG